MLPLKRTETLRCAPAPACGANVSRAPFGGTGFGPSTVPIQRLSGRKPQTLPLRGPFQRQSRVAHISTRRRSHDPALEITGLARRARPAGTRPPRCGSTGAFCVDFPGRGASASASLGHVGILRYASLLRGRWPTLNSMLLTLVPRYRCPHLLRRLTRSGQRLRHPHRSWAAVAQPCPVHLVPHRARSTLQRSSCSACPTWPSPKAPARHAHPASSFL